MKRFAIVLVAALSVLSCTSVAPSATTIVIYVTPPPLTGASAAPASGAAAPSALVPTATPAPVASEAPATRRPPTARPTTAVNMRQPVLRTWVSGGYVTAQVIVPVANDGGTWIALDQFESSWTIKAPDGSVTATQDYFDAVVPGAIGPGETGYAVAEDFTDEFKEEDFDSPDADIYYNEAEPVAPIESSNIRVRKDSLGGITVTGEVYNPADTAIEYGSIVAIFLNDAGEILGYASGSLENVEPGDTKAFEASSSFAEIDLSAIAKTEVYASPD